MAISPKIQAIADQHQINVRFFNPLLEVNLDNPKVQARAVNIARLSQELQSYMNKAGNVTGRTNSKTDAWLDAHLAGAGLSNSTVEDYKIEIWNNLERLRDHD